MYTSPGYSSKTKSPSSPHLLGLCQRLDFLNKFDSDYSSYQHKQGALYRDTSSEEEYDAGLNEARFVDEFKKCEHQLLIRRGGIYSARV
jgi:hypothetical protein